MTPLLLLAAAGCLAVLRRGSDDGLELQLEREVLALREHNRQLREQLEHCDTGPPPAIYTELVQVFSGTEVQVAREGRLVAVEIPGELLFAPGGFRVRVEARMVLDLLATALRLHPDLHVWIVGHTDLMPLSGTLRRRWGTNWELSAVRAASVMHMLVDEFGLPPERFTIAGRGPSAPIADNDTPEGRARNRRVVVVVGPPEAWR